MRPKMLYHYIKGGFYPVTEYERKGVECEGVERAHAFSTRTTAFCWSQKLLSGGVGLCRQETRFPTWSQICPGGSDEGFDTPCGLFEGPQEQSWPCGESQGI